MTIRLLSILSLTLLLLACDDEQSEIKKFGKLKLSINTIGNINAGRASSDNFDNIRKIVVSLETAGGTSVHDMHTLELIRFGNSFVSEELQLETGSYNITKFFVTDEDQNVLYATPLENSMLASLVADPLPVSFVVNADGTTTEVFMEAVNVAETSPEDFGYATFLLGLIDYKSFEVNATVADENYTVSVNGLFEAFAKNAQGQIVWSKSWDITNKLTINIPVAERYSFKLIKAGYLPHAQHYNFEMIEQSNNLSFELIPESSNDFIVKHFPGEATVYFPVDKRKLYTRIDLEEDYAFAEGHYIVDQRDANNITADHSSPVFLETLTRINYTAGEEDHGDDGINFFVNRAINLFDNKPFVDADDFGDLLVANDQSRFFEDFDRDADVVATLYLSGLNYQLSFHSRYWGFQQYFLDYWCNKTPSSCKYLQFLFHVDSDNSTSRHKTRPELSERRKNLLNIIVSH
jgi:hypothetical protein